MIRALLFDLDGTLAETDTLHFEGWRNLLSGQGVEADWDFYQRRVSGRLNPDITAELLPHLSQSEAQRLLDEKEAEFRRRTPELAPLPGLTQVLKESRRRGMKTALVTNAPAENARAMTEALDLAGFFDAEVLAADLPAGKPDPVAYRAALQSLGVAATEALAFEDSPSGIASAVGAGIVTVGIASTHDPTKLLEAGASDAYPDFDDAGLRAMIFG